MISVDATDDVAHPLSRSASAPGQPPPPTQLPTASRSRVFLCHPAKPKADGQPYDSPVPACGGQWGGAAPPHTPPAHRSGACRPHPPARGSPACHLAPRVTKIAQRSFSARGRVLHLGETPRPPVGGSAPKPPFRGAERHKAAVGCPSHYPAPRDMHKKAPVNLTGALNQTFPSTTSPPPSTRRPSSSYPTQPAPGRSPPSPARAHTDDSDKTPHAAAARPAAPHAQPDSHSRSHLLFVSPTTKSIAHPYRSVCLCVPHADRSATGRKQMGDLRKQVAHLPTMFSRNCGENILEYAQVGRIARYRGSVRPLSVSHHRSRSCAPQL